MAHPIPPLSPRRAARRSVRLAALAVLSMLAGCQPKPPPAAPVAQPKTVAAANGEDSGALSSAVRPEPVATRADVLKGSDWPPLQLSEGEALVSCAVDATDNVDIGIDPDPDAGADAGAGAGAGAGAADKGRVERAVDSAPPRRRVAADAARGGDDVASIAVARDGQDGQDGAPTGVPDGSKTVLLAAADDHLVDLGFFSIVDALTPCRQSGGVRLRYAGKIGGEFTELMQRVSAMADRMGIAHRVLDIDSSGGRLEDAMRAGDAIAESRWAIDVRDGAICHSACSLVLAAGDDRRIDGLVGIHRMIRIGSLATSRAEVSQELREVYGKMKDYLERNGASVAVADLMMTVPNRSLRLLSAEELQAYGLSGTNAVQDDLDRIRLTRQCGDEFVKRKDAFARAFDAQCASRDGAEAKRSCDLELRARLEFPEDSCRSDRPLAKSS